MQKEITTKEYFKCSEFTLICTLAYLGFQIEAFEQDPKIPNKVSVVFKRVDDLDDVIECYWQKHITVEPVAYWEMVREIKGRIRSTIEQIRH